jgi:hypothetical protein
MLGGFGTKNMTETLRADPAARRKALLLLVSGAFIGMILIAGFERYRAPLIDWLLSEPAELAKRVKWIMMMTAAVMSAPLVGFAVYLWSLGTKVLRAGEFPPPGHRVIRDTPVIHGDGAVLRGRRFQILAAGLLVASAFLWLLFWRLAGLLREASNPPDLSCFPTSSATSLLFAHI